MYYLDNACADKDELRKLSEKLAEDGNSQENAQRVIKLIGDIGTKKKALYISSLTRACCMGEITVAKFFKLAQCIERLTEEDLDFLNENISSKPISTDEEYIDDYRNCGLLKEVPMGFAYTRRAFELKGYALWYGHDVKIPEIPTRLMQQFDFDYGDIDESNNQS